MPLSAWDLIAVQQLLGHAKPDHVGLPRIPDGALLTATPNTSGWQP
jgi:hypothetical protein